MVFKPEKAEFKPERADFRLERAWGEGRTDKRINGRSNESHLVLYRTSSPLGPLPKDTFKKKIIMSIKNQNPTREPDGVRPLTIKFRMKTRARKNAFLKKRRN